MLGLAQVFLSLSVKSDFKSSDLVGLQMLAGVTCIAAGLLSGEEQLRWLQVALALVGKFGATARWELGTDSSSKFFPFSSISVIFLYTAEMFPTEIRFSL